MVSRSTSRRLVLLRLLGAAAAGLVAACGQKGPLYLPEEPGEPGEPEGGADRRRRGSGRGGAGAPAAASG